MAVIWVGNAFVFMVLKSQWKRLLAIFLYVPATEFIGHKHRKLF